MLPSLRGAAGRAFQAQRPLHINTARLYFVKLPSQVVHERRQWKFYGFGAILGAGLVGWQVLGGHGVHLDSPDRAKLKPKRNEGGAATHDASSSEASSSSSPPSSEEFLQSKEDEALEAGASEDPHADQGAGAETEEGADGANQGAFNPETGEINWDCPCLGGMAHGPCGQQFRDAFSCFVFSEDEPKGINCVEKFKAMQDCFREHPEVYGEEIMRDEEDDEQPSSAPSTDSEDVPAPPSTAAPATPSTS